MIGEDRRELVNKAGTFCQEKKLVHKLENIGEGREGSVKAMVW